MVELYDLKSEKIVKWNMGQISEWFYKINNTSHYSVKNAMEVNYTLEPIHLYGFNA